MQLVTRLVRFPILLRLGVLSRVQAFSVLQRPPPNYEGHVPLTALERGSLAVGSAVMSWMNPYRGGKPAYKHAQAYD